MSKLACHGHNFKQGSVGGMDKHNRRLGDVHSNKDIDVSRSHLNIILRDTDNLYQECKAEIEKVRENGGRLRSDQNWLTEFCVYAPKTEMSYEEYQRYFQEVLGFFRELVGERNIKLATVHMDEKTPHIHLDFMPLVRDEHGHPVKLSSKEIVTRRFLKNIHDELPKRLKSKGFDVQRGDKVTVEDKPLKGRSVHRYKADAEKEKHEIEERIFNLQLDCQDLVSQMLELDDECDDKKQKLAHLASELKKGMEHYQKLEKLENESLNRLEDLSRSIKTIEDGLEASKETIELLEKVIPLADYQARPILEQAKKKAIENSLRMQKAHTEIKKHKQNRDYER